MKRFIATSVVFFAVITGVVHAESVTTTFIGPGLVATPAITSVAAGTAHTCIVRNETAWCTGANSEGQLGLGTFTRTTAFAESSMTTVQKIAAGGNTTCAVRADETLWCWGAIDTSIDSFGFSIRSNSPLPTQVPITAVRDIAVGPYHSCAIQTNGHAWCWGKGRFGQLGNGQKTDSVIPVAIGGHTFIAITVGTDHTCAIDVQHRVWCWGVNAQHRLGLSGNKSRLSPVQVPKVFANSISAGDAFTCVISTDKKVKCWGRNNYGQLGAKAGLPLQKPSALSIKNPVSLTAGTEFACVTTQASTTWCWGRNRYGQLANGSNIAKYKPQKVLTNSSMGSIDHLATGTQHACGVNAVNSAMWCWGLGTSGQLGDSASSNRTRGTITWQNGIQLNSIGSDSTARLVVAGDISCDEARRVTYGVGPNGSQCGAEATALLAKTINPDAVIALGDLQYEGASTQDFRSFYDPTWGALKGITYPVRGNHEYVTNGAAGYVEYFGSHSPSYWTANAGGWRIIAVDSWCQGLLYAGCSATSPQTVWLSAQLRKAHDDGRCALVAMHHPFVSSGPYATSTVQHLWKAAVLGGADLVITGHDHHYERFAPLNEIGSPATSGGTPLIIAGLGGAPTYALRETAPGSQSTDNRTHGVVTLTLSPLGFTSELVSAADGVSSDNYTTTCTP